MMFAGLVVIALAIHKNKDSKIHDKMRQNFTALFMSALQIYCAQCCKMTFQRLLKTNTTNSKITTVAVM